MSEDKNMFDPDNFTVNSPLNGVSATIKEALMIRHNYGGKSSSEVTALRVTVTAEHLEKDRVNLYSAGGQLNPSEDGKTRSLVGPFFVGMPTKGTLLAAFMEGVKKSGFPMERFRDKGFASLDGETFIWGAIERKVNGELKVYEVPTTHVPSTDATVGSGETEEKVRAAILQALETTPEIPRGQITVKVGPLLADLPDRSTATSLLFSEAFLATVPGIQFDKKVLRKAA